MPLALRFWILLRDTDNRDAARRAPRCFCLCVETVWIRRRHRSPSRRHRPTRGGVVGGHVDGEHVHGRWSVKVDEVVQCCIGPVYVSMTTAIRSRPRRVLKVRS